jgi:predicted secreted Zn-dependent protease
MLAAIKSEFLTGFRKRCQDMNLRKKVLALSAVLAIVAPQAEAAAIFREFSYYTVSGKTAADLDKALSRNGPFLKKTGQHHPGAAEIRFDAKVRYGRAPGKACKVQDVYVNVHAKVSLPRWKQRRKATPELAVIWDTLLQDIPPPRREPHRHCPAALQARWNGKYADCAPARIALCFALTSTK